MSKSHRYTDRNVSARSAQDTKATFAAATLAAQALDNAGGKNIDLAKRLAALAPLGHMQSGNFSLPSTYVADHAIRILNFVASYKNPAAALARFQTRAYKKWLRQKDRS